MGKQIKKVQPPKLHKYERVCERCGNGGITKKTEFRCRYCGWWNGSKETRRVVISRGTPDSDR